MCPSTCSYPQTPLILSLVFLSIFTLCYCAPQGYYNPYNPYNPYRQSGYSRAATQANTRRAYASTSRVANNNIYRNRNYSAYVVPTTVATPTLSDAYQRYQRERNNYRVSRADAENAKFVGAVNQEADDEESRTALLLAKKKKLLYLASRNRCLPFGRDEIVGGQRLSDTSATTSAPKEQGRFLWDVNIYNVYPNSPYGSGCGGLGGYGGYGGLGGLAGGLLSDPVAPAYPVNTPLTNLLNLWAPGVLQNGLAATVPPPPLPPQADPLNYGSNNNGNIGANNGANDGGNNALTTALTNALNEGLNNYLASDPAVDPTYRPAVQIPQRRPNRVYFDSAGGGGAVGGVYTPAQIVGSVATTVNGIIQQLTGNVQPVYNSAYGRRFASYG